MTQLSALLTSPTVGLFQRFIFVATAGQTSFSGSDLNGLTLSYKPGYIEVAFNGVVLIPSEYTATNGTTIVFASALNANDVIDITAFSTVTVGDVLAKSQNGADIANTAQFRTNLGLTSYANAVLGQIPGQTGTTLPAAGFVGERIANTATLNFSTSGTAGQVASIPLTAGVWDLECLNQFSGPGATSSSDWNTMMSTTSATISSGSVGSGALMRSRMPSALDCMITHTSIRVRVNPSTTTTYYLNAQATYSGGTYSCSGTIQGTRVS